MTNVSVIIPAYNQAHFIGRAIQSVLDQTYQDFEIIVVDDGSTDNTAEVVHGFEDSRIRYLFQENQGLSAARNKGLRLAQGEFISFLDSDDEFLPHKLELLLEDLSNKPHVGMTSGQAVPIDENGNQIGNIFNRPIPNPVELLLFGNPLHVGSVLLRRSWFDLVGEFDEKLASYEDWDLWLRLAQAGCNFSWVPQPVSLYRFHRAQMTRSGDQMTTATFAVLNKLFSNPHLEGEWGKLRRLAYSRAHLRAAAQDFANQNFNQANAHLGEAVSLNPRLADEDFAPLAKIFRAWVNLPKHRYPLGQLDLIYQNLGDRFGLLKKRRRQELAKAGFQLAFENYGMGNFANARSAALTTIRHDPCQLTNRGFVSVLLRSFGILAPN